MRKVSYICGAFHFTVQWLNREVLDWVKDTYSYYQQGHSYELNGYVVPLGEIYLAMHLDRVAWKGASENLCKMVLKMLTQC